MKGGEVEGEEEEEDRPEIMVQRRIRMSRREEEMNRWPIL